MTSVVKPWLVLTIIFVAGVATGVALSIALSPHFMHPPGEAQMRGHWMAALTRRLDLTPDQQAKIQPIVETAAKNIESLHRDEIDKGSHYIQDANQKIAAFLTPEQKTELQQMESERAKMFSGHMHSHDGPGPMRHFKDRDGGDDSAQPPPPNGTNSSAPSGPPPPPPSQNH